MVTLCEPKAPTVSDARFWLMFLSFEACLLSVLPSLRARNCYHNHRLRMGSHGRPKYPGHGLHHNQATQTHNRTHTHTLSHTNNERGTLASQRGANYVAMLPGRAPPDALHWNEFPAIKRTICWYDGLCSVVPNSKAKSCRAKNNTVTRSEA